MISFVVVVGFFPALRRSWPIPPIAAVGSPSPFCGFAGTLQSKRIITTTVLPLYFPFSPINYHFKLLSHFFRVLVTHAQPSVVSLFSVWRRVQLLIPVAPLLAPFCDWHPFLRPPPTIKIPTTSISIIQLQLMRLPPMPQADLHLANPLRRSMLVCVWFYTGTGSICNLNSALGFSYLRLFYSCHNPRFLDQLADRLILLSLRFTKCAGR